LLCFGGGNSDWNRRRTAKYVYEVGYKFLMVGFVDRGSWGTFFPKNYFILNPELEKENFDSLKWKILTV
jgi:hypothetical protein